MPKSPEQSANEVVSLQLETLELSNWMKLKQAMGRSALAMTIAIPGIAAATVESVIDANPAYADTTFVNNYPYNAGNTYDCSQPINGPFSWCPPGSTNDYSSRGFGIRNCTDGVAY